MEFTEVKITINGLEVAYAEKCPASMSVAKFLETLVQQVLLTPASLRVVNFAGLTIDKADITNINITVTR